MSKRFSRQTKSELVTLIGWLGSKGYAAATKAIMAKLNLTPEILAEWRRTA
jgi:hypothetical protein